MHPRPISSEAELKLAFPVLKELRPDLTFEALRKLWSEEAAKPDGYRALGCFEGRDCVAYMGYRILDDFVHGRHVYVDDLVTKASLRSQGIGALLLGHAEAIAREARCVGLRLCTGIDNEAGKRFYEREGWALRAVVFKKRL